MSYNTILLPTYNERKNVGVIIPEIFAAHAEMRVVVVDDSSPDGTGDEVLRLAREYPHLELLTRQKKEGLGVAYRAGMQYVLQCGDVARIIFMDADGSHGVEFLEPMLQASEEYDLVIGSRYIPGGSVENWEPWRYALSQYGNLYAWIMTGLPVRDLTSGFQCFRGDLLERMQLDSLQASGYAFQIDIKFHAIREAGANAREIPIHFKNRREGESKISRHIIREGLLTPLRLFPRRFTSRS